MSLTRCLLKLGLALTYASSLSVAHASPSFTTERLTSTHLTRLSESLGRVARTEFEARLRDGFAYDLVASITRAEFKSADDQALLQTALAGAPKRGRVKFRAFKRIITPVAGYQITADNGRVFTLSPSPTAGRVLINGTEITFRDRSLKSFSHEVEVALHHSFVVWSPLVALLPHAEAAAPVIFLISISALAIYQTYEAYTAKPIDPLTNPSADPAARAAAQLAQLAKVCDAERESGFITYEQSETSRTLAALAREDLVDIARVSGSECEAEVKRAIEIPSTGKPATPVPSTGNLKILCGNATELARCAETFRRQRPSTSPMLLSEPFEGDGEDSSQ